MYNVYKKYENSPSKNKTEETGINFESAVECLNTIQRLWHSHGGLVLSRKRDELICQEGDGSETITWIIVINEG